MTLIHIYSNPNLEAVVDDDTGFIFIDSTKNYYPWNYSHASRITLKDNVIHPVCGDYMTTYSKHKEDLSKGNHCR